MKIKLNAFRKWNDVTFDLGTRVTKITGESGMGKSTIFEAIYWCLYGRIRSVSPKGSIRGTRTEVTLITEYYETMIQIYRSGMKSVSVIIGDDEYTGDLAQSKIDEYFGSHDMFLMTSYLRAEAVHPLINASPSEKRELTSLVFPDASKFDRYKSKLLQIRRIDEDNLSQIRNNVTSLLSSISTLEDSHSWLKESSLLDSSEVQDDKPIQREIQEISKERDNAIGTLSLLQSLEKQLSSLPEYIDTLPLEEELSECRDKLTQSVVDTKTRDEKIKFLQERVDALLSVLSSAPEESECKRLLNICKTLSSYRSDITSDLQRLDSDYERHSQLLLEYEKSLENIEYNMRIENILECPSCNTKLQYTDKLILYTGDTQFRTIEHNITSGDIQRLRISIDKIEQEKQQCINSYNTYQSIISKEKVLKECDISSYSLKLQEYIQCYKEKQLLSNELNQVMNETRIFITENEKKELNIRISTLSTQISQCKSIEYTRKNLSKQIDTLSLNNQWLSESESYLSSLDTKMKQLQSQLIHIKNIRERMRIQQLYLKRKNDLSSCNEKIQQIEERVNASYKLEHILADAYQLYVGEKLKEIEYDVSLLGKYFFDDTMNITLTPGKETSTGSIRPSFDLHIEYGGTVFEDVKAMSTGERKRLSIILFMVLTKYTDGRMMLLDEAFTSISLDSRGIIMNEIQKLNIPIYLTSHDEIIGYDSELNLNTLI